jgi:hypothetical protein
VSEAAEETFDVQCQSPLTWVSGTVRAGSDRTTQSFDTRRHAWCGAPFRKQLR